MIHRTMNWLVGTVGWMAVMTGAMLPVVGRADDDPAPFVPLFNGRDLTGWHPINVGPETFTVRDGIIVCTGIPTGLLRTEKQYENFILEMEWRHLQPAGNAGLFVWGDALPAVGSPFARGIEVQILDNGYDAKGKNEWFTTHGDVFPVWGATMTPAGRICIHGRRSFPSEDRVKDSPQWNHYRVEARDGELRLSVNGKEVTVGKDCVPRKGYLCLESEGSEVHFRNIKIIELPSTNPTAEQTAVEADGFVPLYTGVDLTHWRADAGHEGHWQPSDWRLVYDGLSRASDRSLWTAQEFQDFVLICDWRWPRKPDAAPQPLTLIRSDRPMPAELQAALTPSLESDAPIGRWNRFVITVQGDRWTVVRNDQPVIQGADFPSLPQRGPLALQHQDAAIEFANILIKPLDPHPK